MPKISRLRNMRKVSNPPRRPYEKERLDAELKLCGEYGCEFPFFGGFSSL